MPARDGFPRKAASHKSVDSVASNISTSSTLRGEELKDIDGWSESPKRISYEDDSSDDHSSHSNASPDRVSSPLVVENNSQPAPSEEPERRKTASWKELPNKGQLALLTLSRLSEPLTQTSLQSYMFYQLKSFDTSLTDDIVSWQAGLLTASFTAAQFVTAIPWGRAADSELFGRKRVLLIGLLGTMVSALGFGFSRTFATAVFFRTLGGALNGNVGVMRTMISEIIKEKKYQSRAFMLLPMTFNVGVIIGPMLGGALSDPISQYPGLFGKNSTFGGETGVWWMQRWPYALPNIFSAFFLFSAALSLFLGLNETHEVLRHQPDRGKQLGSLLFKYVCCRKQDRSAYSAVPSADMPETSVDDVEMQPSKGTRKEKVKPRQRLPIRRIWTPKVLAVLLAHATLAFHVGTFNNLWFVFLSTPRFDPAHPKPVTQTHQSFPFRFNGGLALPPARIGIAGSILGVIGICIQLFIYPRWSGRLGLVKSYRYSLLLFPLSYTLVPYLALLPSTSKAPHEATGPIMWIGIAGVLSVQVMARTFALPGMNILVNNSCPHPSVLGTFHGIAQSISSASRTIGPAFFGWLYGRGLVWGIVGTGFWGMSIAAVVNNFAGAFVTDGNGHEIKLPGEEEDDDESKELPRATK